MNAVITAAVELQEFCQSQQWKFCIIGGLALMRWGEPRETVDVDLTLLTRFGREETYVHALLSRYEPRIPDPVSFALANRVLLLRSESGVGLDVALAGLPFEESAVDRSSDFAFSSNAVVRTCSAEDLVVFKAFAAREKDWLDLEGILIRQAGRLDWNYINAKLGPLVDLKGAPEILAELERRRKKMAD